MAAREAQAMDRIALAEQAAVQAVQAPMPVEIAIRAATGLVVESIDQDGAAALVDKRHRRPAATGRVTRRAASVIGIS